MSLTAEQRRKLKDAAALELGRLIMAGDFDLVARDPELPAANAEPTADADAADTIVQAVLAVGRARRDTLDRLRAALQRNDTPQALSVARQLVNLEAPHE